MDSQDRPPQLIDQILDQPLLANRFIFNSRELSDRFSCFSDKSYLDFNIDQSIDNAIKIQQMPLPLPLEPDQCHSIRQEVNDDTNHLQDFHNSDLEPQPDPQQAPIALQNQINCTQQKVSLPARKGEDTISKQAMEQIVIYLVQNANVQKHILLQRFEQRFPGCLKNETVLDLVQKFNKLKKTKEELVKYCMRKAFKFILELPKNKDLLDIKKDEKFSLARCKSRFLKKISEEKSMNHKFLGQIFQEKDFSEDYLFFLNHFDNIMEQDNDRKVKCLAELLTDPEGKVKSVDMVRRLPWTRTILNKVAKISRELLKHSPNTQ